MDRVSVPSVGVSLSAPLRVVGLVGHYPTNYLMRHRPLKKRIAPLPRRDYRVLRHLSMEYPQLFGEYLCITTSFAVGLNPLDLHALSTPLAFILS